ncbi:TPR-like protein [Thozetella sp. PMI_491]|nr:TPR-like protein [Thozetella sp. PMI_491]
MVRRDGIWSRLAEKLKPSAKKYQTAALWGLGGSGKTQIALDFAHTRHIQTACSIFWINADSEARFLQSYKAIARQAGVSPYLDNEDLMIAVRQWIESQRNWTMILDNADDLSLFGVGGRLGDGVRRGRLYHFIPRGLTGTVLWTSRDERVAGSLVSSRQAIWVDAMTLSEALTLLASLRGEEISEGELDDATQLLSHLERLPLAISHAAAYLRTSPSIMNYVFKLRTEHRRWKLLRQPIFDRYRPELPNSVLETWIVSVTMLKEENYQAYWILHTLAYFDNRGISFEMIKAAETIRANEAEERITDANIQCGIDSSDDDMDEEDDIVTAVGRLKNFSFIRPRSPMARSYDMHALVQDATRYSLRIKATTANLLFFRTALNVLLRLYPPSVPENWKLCEIYLPHALRVCNWPERKQEGRDVADLLEKVSHYLFDQRRWREKELVDTEVLKLRRELSGEEHPETLQAMANLASTYHALGRLEEDAKMSARVLSLRTEILGEKHPDTIDTMANLASTYFALGRLAEDEEISAKALALRREILGDKHPDTLSSIENFGAIHLRHGRFKEAEAIYVEVLTLRRESLGQRHPNTLKSMMGLATTFYVQRRWEKAEKILNETLMRRLEILGREHPDTIDTMESLAWTYSALGRETDDAEMSLQVLSLREKILGESHPDTMSSREHIRWMQKRMASDGEPRKPRDIFSVLAADRTGQREEAAVNQTS